MSKNIQLKDLLSDISRIPNLHSEFVLTKDSKERMRAALERHIDISQKQYNELNK